MTRRIACALTIALAATRPGVAADETRITNVSNVQLRTAPATDASVAGELPLGTELIVVGNTGGPEAWFHVRTIDRRDGWVSGGALTTSVDPGRRDQIVEARLREGGNFSANIQLVDLI